MAWIFWDLRVDGVEEADEPLVAMALHVAADRRAKLSRCTPAGGSSGMATPGRFAAVPRMGDERLERSWHWMSFLSHVASAAHSSLTSTSRRKQERRCDLRHSSRHGLITIQFLSCGICPV